MKTYTYKEIAEKYGEEIAEKAISSFEPTNRLMYPAFENPEHLDKDEWAGEPVEIGDDTITAYCYLSDEDDTDVFDWEGNAEFTIE